MLSYKLAFHEFPGRSDPTRLAFYIAGIPLDEESVTFEKYLSIHDSLPLGQLPILTIDGKKVIPHENAVLKLAGQLAGLYPSDNDEALSVDAVLGVLNDLIWLNLVFFTPDFSGKDSTVKLAIEAHIPDALSQIEKYLASSGTTYSAGKKLTVADLKLFSVIRAYKSGFFQSQGLPANIADKYSLINKHFALVIGHDKVASWVKAHPVN